VLLFSLLDERPSALKISTPSRVGAGETIDITAVRTNAPDAGILRFRLTDPEGVSLRDYQSLSLTVGEKVKGIIHLPYNCLTGDWKLEVTDLITGISGIKTITVERSVIE